MSAMGGSSEPIADVVVLGAGISGLVSASVLLQQGNSRVIILDDYDRVGGNHIDRSFGGFTFDVGSLIFQDDSPLLNHFREILPLYVPVKPTWERLNPQGRVTRYPFSIWDDVLSAGPVECLRMIVSGILGRFRKRRPRNVRDFAERWMGARFVERSGLGHYIKRMCGLPPEEVDLAFAKSRLGWIEERASVRKLLPRAGRGLGGNGSASSQNTQLVRPREGYAFLYQPAVERLMGQGAEFRLSAKLQEIRRVGGQFEVLADDWVVRAKRIVSTIPVDRASELCGIPPLGEPLPTVRLISLFFSFRGDRGFNAPILYNFSHEGAWKRFSVYSDFYGESEGKVFFTAEVIAREVGDSSDLAERDFRAHCKANDLFIGDLRLEGSHVLDNAYPIYTADSQVRAREAIIALRNFGLESLGRQGGFQYQPTARASTVEAERALQGT